MLVTRLCETRDPSPWSFTYHNRPPSRSSSPRMSDKQFPPAPVEPDWQGQYAHVPQIDSEAYPQRSSVDARNHGQNSKARLATDVGHHAVQSRGLKASNFNQGAVSSISHSPQRSPSITSNSSSVVKSANYTHCSNPSSEPFPFSKPSDSSNAYYYRPQGDQISVIEPSQSDREDKEQSLDQEAGYDVEDQDDGDGTEDRVHSRHQTVAERLAARRKMKRFRLTHQQTRFLMSEFAKQPHPDAAHRERLSREIPGLSPRQVQVWFQNRRAKIKRLTADDRDRMIRMRAVPDDFDNVQALHSPYGAVHGIAPVLSPSHMGPTVSPYPNRGSRPVVLDMRRAGGESYASPTGLTQSFGGIDIGQAPPGMGHSELALTTSPLYHDRYGSSASSPVASGLGYRAPSSAYWNSATSSIGSVSPPSRSAYRDSNPLQGRDWGCRSVSETVQTPTGMYQGQSPTTDAPDRQIGYSNAQFDHSNPSGFGGLEAQTYPDLPGRASDGNVTGMRGDSSMSRGRVPAVTTEGPLSMDFGFRDSYQSVGLPPSLPHQQHQHQHQHQHPHPHPHQHDDRSQHLPSLRQNMTPPSSNYSRGGPVSASLEMATDRPLLVQGENMGEYPVPQLPAPMPASGGLSRPFPPPTSNRDPSSGSLGL